MTAAPACFPELLSIGEVAKRLKLSTKTIRRWIERGELRVYRLGGQIRIAERDLVAFLNERYG
jgi:excisionase family DNA binding protein